MKGYKVFNPDWTCRGYQFKVGKTFTEDVIPVCCYKGFHFCTEIVDCFEYYPFNPNNKVAEVEALDDIDISDIDSKCSTNKIHIIRELTWHEVLEMVNTGEDCTGFCNTGKHNSGDRNSGNKNSGDSNSGSHNSGNFNSGNHCSGNCNSGNYNSGHCNSGGSNSGNFNSGHCNSGDKNSGNHNMGNHNSGNHNNGNWNSGYCNSGSWNSGHCNSGRCNSGSNNSGNCNSGDNNRGSFNNGDWNKGNFSNGCFNTEASRIFLFNKPSDWTYQDWLNSDAHYILMDCPRNILEWVREDDMTNEEKENHPEYSSIGGFLKSVEEEKGRQSWWDGLTKVSKDIVMSIPNFDKDIFKEMTGIDVEGDE